jgi:hypothetical protein
MAGTPGLYLTEEKASPAGLIGEQSQAWVVPNALPMLIQADGELWATAGPGGLVDCRYWEIRKVGPAPGY